MYTQLYSTELLNHLRKFCEIPMLQNQKKVAPVHCYLWEYAQHDLTEEEYNIYKDYAILRYELFLGLKFEDFPETWQKHIVQKTKMDKITKIREAGKQYEV